MAAYPNPLTEEDYAKLNELCRSCHGTAQLIADCKECGLPVEEQEAANNAQHQLALNLKKKFFPLNT